MKIFIPSYKRGSLITTHNIFKNFIDDIIIVIHEFDEENYAHIDTDKLVLSDSIRGIGRVRNAILAYARQNNITKYGIIDDDILFVGKRNENKYQNYEGRKSTTAGYDSIEITNEFIDNVSLLLDEFAIYSIPLSGFARLRNLSKTKNNLVINSLMPFTFVFINTDKIDKSINYDTNLRIWEDGDFALKVLKSGENVVSDFNYCFHAHHKIEGGCFEQWSTVSQQEVYDSLIARHDSKYIIKFAGKFYNRINFKHFKNQYNGHYKV